MEKIISPEERIKRAEEIYYRRKLNNNNVRMPSSQVKQGRENRQFSLYKKMILQILICVFIYLIFSLIKETNYIFSESVLNKTKEFLSTDINFAQISSSVGEFFQNNQDKFGFLTKLWNKEETSENKEENNQSENNTEENANQNEEGENTQQNSNENSEENSEENNQNQQNSENNQSDSNQQNNEQAQNLENENSESKQASTNNEEIGIGGSNEDVKTVQVSAKDTTQKTQMQIDAEYIKQNFSMTLPAKAKITSPYGKREPTEIVSENHQGIDIGVVVGTPVVAAMKGTVSVVSNVGDYGTHVKIVNKDVTTIYAHCSKILVKEGDKVKKGQKIALSGNTGNTTGPHLHFEIRRSERTVDPELILSWT